MLVTWTLFSILLIAVSVCWDIWYVLYEVSDIEKENVVTCIFIKGKVPNRIDYELCDSIKYPESTVFGLSTLYVTLEYFCDVYEMAHTMKKRSQTQNQNMKNLKLLSSHRN